MVLPEAEVLRKLDSTHTKKFFWQLLFVCNTFCWVAVMSGLHVRASGPLVGRSMLLWKGVPPDFLKCNGCLILIRVNLKRLLGICATTNVPDTS